MSLLKIYIYDFCILKGYTNAAAVHKVLSGQRMMPPKEAPPVVCEVSLNTMTDLVPSIVSQSSLSLVDASMLARTFEETTVDGANLHGIECCGGRGRRRVGVRRFARCVS